MNSLELPDLSVLADDARRSPVRLALELAPAECQRLADFNALAAVDSFRLAATAFGMKGRGLRVEGTITADVVYTCGVSLQTYRAHLDIPFEQMFAPPGRAAPTLDIDPLDDTDIEPLVDGAARVADLGYQLFTLALDPFPRHPGLAPAPAEPEPDGDEGDARPTSPFAALKSLKS